MKPILTFENVTKQYPNGVHALQNISFSVNAGEFISIIGPSGSGKSTILRSINKLITISDGHVRVEGEDISTLNGRRLKAARCKVGMIFQNYNLVYRLSVMQNVLHGRLGHMSGLKGILGMYTEEDKKRAIELLEELGLSNFCYNRASDLSGGQKQRVGIARAIMQEPSLLLCDEPNQKYTGTCMGIYSFFFSWNRYRCWICGIMYYQLCIYGSCVCRNNGRYFTGLSGKPAGSRSQFPTEGGTWCASVLYEWFSFLVFILCGGKYPGINNCRHGRRWRNWSGFVLLY